MTKSGRTCVPPTKKADTEKYPAFQKWFFVLVFVYSVGASTTVLRTNQNSNTQLLLLRFREQQQQLILIKTTFVKTALNATNDFSAILVDQREHPLPAGVRKKKKKQTWWSKDNVDRIVA
jgi:hypothetical protein